MAARPGPAARIALDLQAVLMAMRSLVTGLTELTWVTAGYGWLTLVAPILVGGAGLFRRQSQLRRHDDGGGRLQSGAILAALVRGQFLHHRRLARHACCASPDFRRAVLIATRSRREVPEPPRNMMDSVSPAALLNWTTMRCWKRCSARPSASSGKARKKPACWRATAAPPRLRDPADDLVAVGGSGFGMMALVVAVERGWVTRNAALMARLAACSICLERATCYHGAFPHFLHGKTGRTIPFGAARMTAAIWWRPSFLMMGLLTARQYFDRAEEAGLRARITALVGRGGMGLVHAKGEDVLTWHWSPNNGLAMNHRIRGWNETLITYVLAAGARATALPRMCMTRASAPGRIIAMARPIMA